MRAILLLFIVMYTSLSLAHAYESVSKKTPSEVLIHLSDHSSDDNRDDEQTSPDQNDCSDENIPSHRSFSLITFDHIKSDNLIMPDCLFERDPLKRPPASV